MNRIDQLYLYSTPMISIFMNVMAGAGRVVTKWEQEVYKNRVFKKLLYENISKFKI